MTELDKRVIRGLGWKPDLPDIRDHRFSAVRPVAPIDQLPNSVDLRPFMSPVREQGNLGSCTGFAACAAVEYLRRTDADHWSTIYSPLFVYYGAREIDNSIPIDAGAYIRDTVKVINKQGVPPESAWEYERNDLKLQSKFKKKPTQSAYKAAQRWLLGQYVRCDSLNDVLNALAQKKPVVIGFACFSNMFTKAIDESGDIPMPSGSMLGGHAVCLCGYDKPSRRVLFKNSWGMWGKEGYGTLPFAFLDNTYLADDFWSFMGEAETKSQSAQL